MVKAAVAGVIGFVLIFVESMIVIYIKGCDTVQFGDMASFVNVWAMNFFLVFSIFTQITNWIENRQDVEMKL